MRENISLHWPTFYRPSHQWIPMPGCSQLTEFYLHNSNSASLRLSMRDWKADLGKYFLRRLQLIPPRLYIIISWGKSLSVYKISALCAYRLVQSQYRVCSLQTNQSSSRAFQRQQTRSPVVGPGKNCKRFVFRTMLFLKVSKTIIQESRKIQSWEICIIFNFVEYHAQSQIQGVGVAQTTLDHDRVMKERCSYAQLSPNGSKISPKIFSTKVEKFQTLPLVGKFRSLIALYEPVYAQLQSPPP